MVLRYDAPRRNASSAAPRPFSGPDDAERRKRHSHAERGNERWRIRAGNVPMTALLRVLLAPRRSPTVPSATRSTRALEVDAQAPRRRIPPARRAAPRSRSTRPRRSTARPSRPRTPRPVAHERRQAIKLLDDFNAAHPAPRPRDAACPPGRRLCLGRRPPRAGGWRLDPADACAEARAASTGSTRRSRGWSGSTPSSRGRPARRPERAISPGAGPGRPRRPRPASGSPRAANG